MQHYEWSFSLIYQFLLIQLLLRQILIISKLLKLVYHNLQIMNFKALKIKFIFFYKLMEQILM
ncbi:MAG: hypothetical protein DMG62_22045 [Acidobacteria bacterium]|nr:MAG: hypothetical protein DMG62_22045 [Acidobacteriota bacterium]